MLLDEPTSALDVLTQANIMNVLKRIKREAGTSFILITHDIATSSELADRVAVMYAGHLVEISDATRFFGEPLHPTRRSFWPAYRACDRNKGSNTFQGVR